MRHEAGLRKDVLMARLVAWVSLVLVALCCGSAGFAQEEDEDDNDGYIAPPKIVSPKKAKKTNDGPGVIGRASFLGMSTLGRDDSIAPLEVMPYVLFDPHLVFADVRAFVSTEGQFGGNLGVGYRFLNEEYDAWYGINAWYDLDQTSGELFQQLGLGLEAAWSAWELRSNFYLPVGDRQQLLESTAVDARFVGNQILFDQHSRYGNSLAGFDAEIGRSFLAEFFDREQTFRGFVGYYHFAADLGNGVTGFRTRVEADLSNTILTQVEFTSDDEYGQNLMVGVSLEFPWGGSHPSTNWHRNTPSPFRWVQRNYNVILDRSDVSATNSIAVNPRTGQPYFVQHVDTAATGAGNGTAEAPYQTYAPTSGHAADIVFVHAGSRLTESLLVAENTRVLGDNGSQTVLVQGVGNQALPSLADGAATPLISHVNGTAVTLSSGSELSGFVIEDITGRGILAADAGDILIADVTLQRITGDALVFDQMADGVITLRDLSVTDVSGNGLALLDIDADVTATALTFDDVDQASILISGGEGEHSFLGTTAVSGAHGPVRIEDASGHVEFADLRLTGNSSTPLLVLEDITGDVEFASLTLENTGGPGVKVRDVDLLTISAGTLVAHGGPALDAEDSELAIQLSELSVDDGPVGLRLEDTLGFVAITGGTIENADVAVSLNRVSSVALTGLTLTDNAVGVQSRAAEYLRLQDLVVTGTAGYALDSVNDELLSVINSDFAGNGALDAGTLRVQADTTGTYRSEFSGNEIFDTRGTPLYFGTLPGGAGAMLSTTLTNNSFTASRGSHSALQVAWNGPLEILASSNELTLNGASMTGFDVAGLSATNKVTATITANTIDFTEAHGVGIDVAAPDTSTVEVTANQITFDAAGGVGLQFTFLDAAEAWISSNRITDDGGGATGMLFHRVAAGSKLQIENNQISLSSASSSIDRGIIFETIEDSIELFGQFNNLINGAADVYYIPSGTTTGSFFINGASVP